MLYEIDLNGVYEINRAGVERWRSRVTLSSLLYVMALAAG